MKDETIKKKPKIQGGETTIWLYKYVNQTITAYKTPLIIWKKMFKGTRILSQEGRKRKRKLNSNDKRSMVKEING